MRDASFCPLRISVHFAQTSSQETENVAASFPEHACVE